MAASNTLTALCVWLHKDDPASSQGIQLALHNFKLEEKRENVVSEEK